jgi:hypothetical protein
MRRNQGRKGKLRRMQERKEECTISMTMMTMMMLRIYSIDQKTPAKPS